MIFERAIDKLKSLSSSSVKEERDIFHVYDFPAGPLCRNYRLQSHLKDGIFFRSGRRLLRWLSWGMTMNPVYWILKPLCRLFIYPLWRFMRFFAYGQMIVWPALNSQKTNQEIKDQKPLGCRDVVSAEIRTRYRGAIRLRLWRHYEKGKGCVICLPPSKKEGYLCSCLWPEERGDIPMNWIQYDYRKTGESQGDSCRFEDLVDDAQGVVTYAKAFLGLEDEECFLVGEGVGKLIAESLSKRFPQMPLFLIPPENSIEINHRSLFKGFLRWIVGWPLNSEPDRNQKDDFSLNCVRVLSSVIE